MCAKQRLILIFGGDYVPRIQGWSLRQWCDSSVIDTIVVLVSEVGEPQNIGCFSKSLSLKSKD